MLGPILLCGTLILYGAVIIQCAHELGFFDWLSNKAQQCHCSACEKKHD